MSDAITRTAVLEVAHMFRVQWEQAQNCYVVLYPEGMVKLSTTAGEIMKRIDGESSVAQIIGDLTESFAGADVEQDVLKFLEVAHGNGWIRAKRAV